MSVQDKLEGVLREIHILFANSKKYANSDDLIVVDKSKVFALLNQLNVHVYEMMDEHEVTQQSRDKMRREAQFRGEKMIRDAEKSAEDVYAASVMYTYEALHQVQSVIDQANNAMTDLLKNTQKNLLSQKETIRENQSELKEQLQDMADARTYFKLLEQHNRELEKRKKELEEAKAEEANKDLKKASSLKSAGVKPEVKINPGYFEKAGISMEKIYREDDEPAKVAEKPEIKINLNAEYFKRKNEAETGIKEPVEETQEVVKTQGPETKISRNVDAEMLDLNEIEDTREQRKLTVKAGIKETLGKIKKELINAELPQSSEDEIEEELRLDETTLGKMVKKFKDED